MQIKVIETIEKNFTDIYISFSGYIEDVKFFEDLIAVNLTFCGRHLVEKLL